MNDSRHPRSSHARQRMIALVLLLLPALLVLPALPAQAQDGRAVQTLSGNVEEPGSGALYAIRGLEAGQLLSVRVERISGNLDPFVALSDVPYNAGTLRSEFWAEVGRVISAGQDPVRALPLIYDEFFIAWDDDSGAGYNAAFEFEIPADGDYQLVVTNSPAADSFGDYRLLIGLDAPEVLTNEVLPTGDEIAVLDLENSGQRVALQEITGSFSGAEVEREWTLRPMRPGDTFYAYLEPTSGNLAPRLVLEDFGGKPLASANLSGSSSIASLSHSFSERVRNVRLIAADLSGEEGDYRLLVGVNSPDVLSGKGEPTYVKMIQGPVDVQIGLKLQQITKVDQVAENFGAVAQLEMRWQDDELAYSPEECECQFREFNLSEFNAFASRKEAEWPQFTVFNQQGNRWIQNQNIVVWPDGRALYFERFTTDFQAPEFNFVKFPFDTQDLYMRIDSLFNARQVTYTASESLSGIGDKLGEEQWYVIESASEATVEDNTARYNLRFTVQRQLIYYILRIFVPIIIIIIVAWFSFFLKDYGKRVDVAGANLLVFVAFNFTISGELPRLGYLTFMDVVLAGTFVITAIVVVFNVFLKRLELAGHRSAAERIDAFSIWIYPLAYAVGGILAYYLYLR